LDLAFASARVRLIHAADALSASAYSGGRFDFGWRSYRRSPRRPDAFNILHPRQHTNASQGALKAMATAQTQPEAPFSVIQTANPIGSTVKNGVYGDEVDRKSASTIRRTRK